MGTSVKLSEEKPDGRKLCKVYLKRLRITLCGARLRTKGDKLIWQYHGNEWIAGYNDRWEYVK